MAADWNVDKALEEVTDSIEGATVCLNLGNETRSAVHDLYRKCFAARTEAEWRLNRNVVLERAGLAGRCAETATITSWVDGVGEVCKVLDNDSVLMVCVMVSRLYCPANDCVFCPDVDYTAPKGKKLDEILKQIESLG